MAKKHIIDNEYFINNVLVFDFACEHKFYRKNKLNENNHRLNPFTAPTCKVSGLKDARTRPQAVYFPVL